MCEFIETLFNSLFSANAESVLLRAQSRRTIKGSIHVTSDLQAIPSATGKSAEESLKKLSQIPEFEKQLKLSEEIKDEQGDVEMLAAV
jgi:hypothetical protein